ncbi:hypothetical protein CFAM422_003782 [Trichoderma lentiforme]|uniref:Transducin/WD40 repeat-like superfamily protein n=1 Tax=Trichoderma lentiforme TaxID=1567552 RepID=A0A9P4XKU4_9HYPO|nr:hypothetical protein CFAM422_003782 [Trichoderma lentiforme]
MDGYIFKWHPLMDDNVEARAAADEIAASPNGKVFATSSSNGTVRIWNFAHFSIAYQISSDDLVTGLTFSPDSGRLYDLRGGSINAWEPTSLTRFLESQYGIGDINEKIESHEVLPASTKSHIRNFGTVTAMAPAPNSRSYCVGHEDGTVILLQKRNSDGVGFAKFHNFLSAEHITWSKDGKYVAVADLAEEVQVKAPHQDNDRPLEISSLSSPQVDLGAGNIEETIFNLDSKLLFSSTRRKGFVCHVIDGAQQFCCELKPGSLRQWLPHPTEPSLLLAFGPVDVLVYTWCGLKRISPSIYLELQRPGLVSR